MFVSTMGLSSSLREHLDLPLEELGDEGGSEGTKDAESGMGVSSSASSESEQPP